MFESENEYYLVNYQFTVCYFSIGILAFITLKSYSLFWLTSVYYIYANNFSIFNFYFNIFLVIQNAARPIILSLRNFLSSLKRLS